ncbi:MAG: hypothetical protein M3434_04385 [Gemmatimonadota bacterium]|nr:hypothetical protein [Gemmatimonadota bacterium]
MHKLLRTATRFSVPALLTIPKNSRRAAMVKAARWAVGKVKPEPKRTPPAIRIAKGLGAAAVTLPLGLWIGRIIRGRDR